MLNAVYFNVWISQNKSQNEVLIICSVHFNICIFIISVLKHTLIWLISEEKVQAQNMLWWKENNWISGMFNTRMLHPPPVEVYLELKTE